MEGKDTAKNVHLTDQTRRQNHGRDRKSTEAAGVCWRKKLG